MMVMGSSRLARVRRITSKIDAIQRDHDAAHQARTHRTILNQAFEEVTAIVRSPGFDLNEVWDNASDRERRVMVEELIEAVTIYARLAALRVSGLDRG